MTGGWTPERRLAQSRRCKRYWSSPEGRRHRQRLRDEASGRFRKWAEKYPDRAALVERVRAAINAGETIPMLCDRECGRTGAPLYDWEKLELAGWRCYDCRKAMRDSSATEATTPDEVQQGPFGGSHSPTATSPTERDVVDVAVDVALPAQEPR